MDPITLAIVGCIALALIMVLLISGKMHPIVPFVLIPFAAALVCGFTLEDINGFIAAGMNSIMPSLIQFMFSITFFCLMSDVGLFDPLIQILTPKKTSVFLVLLSTLLITYISHLDGSGATTFIVTMSACLPLADRLRIRHTTIMATLCFGIATAGLVPWGGPPQYASIAIGEDIMTLFFHYVPVLVGMVVLDIGVMAFFAKLERSNGAGIVNEDGEASGAAEKR